MRWISWLTGRVRAMTMRNHMDADMDTELRFHMDMSIAERVNRGQAPDDARRDAAIAFGGMSQVRETYSDARGARWFHDLMQDVRYGARSLRQAAGFTTVAVLTLALGIGASTAIFSVVYGVLLRPLPYPNSGSIVAVWETDRNSGTDSEGASVPDYLDFVARSRSFSAIAAIKETQANRTTSDGVAERVSAARVSRSLLPVLGITPAIGRGFSQAEDAPGGAHVAIVSDRFWRTRLAGSADVLGSTLRMDDSVYTVIGVLPPAVHFPGEDTDIWMPLQLTAASGPRSRHDVAVVARLAPGTSFATASREMTNLARALEEENPSTNRARGVRLESLEDVLVGNVRRPLFTLLAAVAVVVLIACANTANLLLARLAARTREVAVRTALGATRRRLVQQFFAESLMLTVASAVCGIALAFGLLRVLALLAPASLPRADQVRMDSTVLAATLGLSVLVAMAFGILPALVGRKLDVQDALRSGGARTGGTGRENRRYRSVLVVSEVALSLVLVVAAGLLLQSFWRLQQVDPGFATRGVLRLEFQLPESRYPQSYDNFPLSFARIIAFEHDLVERVEALPGVQAAAVASNDPLSAGFTNSFVIEGREAEFARGQAELPTRPVSAGYFPALGVPLLRGRFFTSRDDASAPPVVIINQAAATKYFRDVNAVGQRITFWGVRREIVGVVGNERFHGLAADAPPAMYPPITQAPMASATLLVRSSGDPADMLPAVRGVIHDLDPLVAPFDVTTMDQVLSASIGQQRFTMLLLTAFATVALALALIGIYGVVSYTVTQRTSEIGIRRALGATNGDVMRGVVRQGLMMAIVGAVIGLIGAVAAGRLLANQLFGVAPADVPTLTLGVAAILGIAVLGSWLPARRAAQVSLLRALRAE